MDGKSSATDLDELLQHSGWIRNLAYANLRDYALAEDVTQEVLLKALAGPRRTGRLLSAWLKAVTVNTARNELRGSGRRRVRELKVARSEKYVSDEDQDDVIVAFRELTIAVEALSPQHRRIIVLRFFRERTFKQIAVELELSESHARVKLHRALKQLRETMGQRDGDWRANCLLLAPAAGMPAPPLSLLTISITLALASAVILIGGGSWWGANTSSESGSTQHPLVRTEGQAATTNEPAVIKRAEFFSEQTEASPSQGSFVSHVQDAEMLALLHGVPVPDARVVVFQDGKLEETTTNEVGRFHIRVDPNRFFGLSIVGENAAKSIGNTLYSSTIELDEIKNEKGWVDFSRWSHDSEGIAHVRVYVDWTSMFNVAPPRRQYLELVAEGDVSLPDSFEIPAWVPYLSTVVEVTAEGILPLREFVTGSQFGIGVIYLDLHSGEARPIRLVDLNDVPLAFVDVMQGFPFLDVEKTDADGVLPPTGPWRSDFPVGAMPEALVVKLNDGRLWMDRSWRGQEGVVSHDVGLITITVDESLIIVELDADMPSGVNTIEVVSANLDLNRALLSPYNNGPWEWGSEEFLDFPWTSIKPGETVELKKGVLGPGTTVHARLQPGGWYLGEFQIVDGKAVVKAKVCNLHVSFSGLEQNDSRALFVELEQISVPKGPRVNQRVLLEGSQTEIAVPEGVFSFKLLEKKAGRFVNLPLAENERGARAFHVRGKEMRVELEVLPQTLRKTLIRVNGTPVLKGEIDGNPLSLDGEVMLPFDSDGNPILWSVNLSVSPAIGILQGVGVGFLPTTVPGKFSVLPDGRMAWDLQLAKVELTVPASTQRDERYLRRPLFSPDQHVDGTRGPTQRVGYLGISVISGENQMKIPQHGGAIQFLVPVGRYRFSVGTGWKNQWEVKYGLENGVAVEKGILNIFHPD